MLSSLVHLLTFCRVDCEGVSLKITSILKTCIKVGAHAEIIMLIMGINVA